MIVNQFLTLEDAEKQFTKHLSVTFQRGFHTNDDITRTRDVLARHPGKTSVFFIVDSVDEETPGGQLRYFLMPPQELKVTCNAELTEELSSVVGSENFRFHADSKIKSGAGAGSTGR